MTCPKVYVTRELPQKALSMLKEECEVEVNPHDRPLTRLELKKAIEDVDGLLCLLTDQIDAELLDLNPKLKVIANYAVGYDNIELKACTERGIAVSNTPGVLTETTADLTWALLMSVARRIVEGDKFTRAGNYENWGPMMLLGKDISGKTLGIVGMGRIGEAVAKRAKGFDMEVLYYDLERKDRVKEQELSIKYREFDTLLQEADFISLHVPLNSATENLISERELELMKESAYLINTSRGAVIDEQVLVYALRNGEIAGAGLDVYEDEPKLTPGLAKLNNVVVTPHIGSASIDTRTKMATMAAENLLAGLQDEEMPNLLNPEVLD
ncbi:2-hydroxyacid dehydrogenase [Sporohalobacter salinus]|uniref:2-hydroxyacid dehydrogenase n=1 Tax=Sporohalobacter salinus TaxID=1494606 RepID=UPI001EF92CCC|nr:D-glycerate dehydrogenase [Sporohalobacter salinus]MBM7624422.1 glyoxylate reductase [Sporohalobacter salinus]